MLSRHDDYPIHQTPEPIARPASTDRHVYDRYWFNGYTGDGEFYFGIGAARYPNLGIMDCAFSIVRDGEQHAFHASRRAPREPSEIEVGPFKIDITEPMMSARVSIESNETGIDCDLEWIPRTANFEERRQTNHQGRTVMDATRFNQFGFWRGEIRHAGQTLAIEPEHVYGTKDRSWGIRPVGDRDPGGAPATRLPQIYFLWAPLHWRDRCTHAGLFENEHGERWHCDGMIVPAYASPGDIPGVEDPDTQPLAGVEYRLEYFPGTRRARHAEFTLLERGGARQLIELEPLLCFRMKGLGYIHPEWGHGRWKGELAIGGEFWSCDELDELALDNVHIQQVMRARCGEEEGIGVLEQICLGAHAPSGFTQLLDGAS
jgi:hypothetical protein